MKRMVIVFAALALLCTSIPAVAQQAQADTPKGSLLIIGGGPRPQAMMERFVELAGGKDAGFLVISTAGLPEERGQGLVDELAELGVKRAQWIDPTREECEDPAFVAKVLDGVTGVFFTGGSQRKIADTIRSTKFHDALWKVYREGGVIGGTSAGAAMMSDPMMSGRRNDGSDAGFNEVAKGNVEVVPGMGFLPGVLLDQHFFKRARENRMLSAALDHPQSVTIGIDESTALLVTGGRDIEVLGLSNVLVVEPDPALVKTDAAGNYGIPVMNVRLLIAGDKYTITPGGSESTSAPANCRKHASGHAPRH